MPESEEKPSESTDSRPTGDPSPKVSEQAKRAEPAASKNRARLPRRSFVSNMPDRGLFALVAIVGFVGIIVLKLRGQPSELVAALAVALMFAYGVIAYRIPAVQIRLDRLGDNIYYLGFILTLASMSAALIQLRDGIEMSVILGNFGIALVTTIVGIAGRVVFVQMKSELDDVETELRRDLLANSMELKGQMATAIREFETFRIAMRQAMEEQHKKDIDALGEVAREYIKKFGRVTQAAVENLEGVFGGQESATTKLKAAIEDFVGTTAQLREKLGSFDTPLGTIHQNLSQFGDELVPLLDNVLVSIDRAQRRKRRWWPWGRSRRPQRRVQ